MQRVRILIINFPIDPTFLGLESSSAAPQWDLYPLRYPLDTLRQTSERAPQSMTSSF